jgi:hypothetical protein
MKTRFLIPVILILQYCTGLAPEPQHATFLMLKNDSGEILRFGVDDAQSIPVRPGDDLMMSVEPGMHVEYGPIVWNLETGPDTFYVAPCDTRTVTYGYIE